MSLNSLNYIKILKKLNNKEIYLKAIKNIFKRINKFKNIKYTIFIKILLLNYLNSDNANDLNLQKFINKLNKNIKNINLIKKFKVLYSNYNNLKKIVIKLTYQIIKIFKS